MSEQRTIQRLLCEMSALEREVAHLRAITAEQADTIALLSRPARNYRVKLQVPCGDVHYFYAHTPAGARELEAELHRHLAGVEHQVWTYLDVQGVGHIRVDAGLAA